MHAYFTHKPFLVTLRQASLGKLISTQLTQHTRPFKLFTIINLCIFTSDAHARREGTKLGEREKRVKRKRENLRLKN